MPIYEYICHKCDHEFEREQRITDEPIKTCPQCRSRRVERLISLSAFHLKGSGWYLTDYARKGRDGDGDAKGESGDGSSKADAKKSDKKSESKKPASIDKKKKAAASS